MERTVRRKLHTLNWKKRATFDVWAEKMCLLPSHRCWTSCSLINCFVTVKWDKTTDAFLLSTSSLMKKIGVLFAHFRFLRTKRPSNYQTERQQNTTDIETLNYKLWTHPDCCGSPEFTKKSCHPRRPPPMHYTFLAHIHIPTHPYIHLLSICNFQNNYMLAVHVNIWKNHQLVNTQNHIFIFSKFLMLYVFLKLSGELHTICDQNEQTLWWPQPKLKTIPTKMWLVWFMSSLIITCCTANYHTQNCEIML